MIQEYELLPSPNKIAFTTDRVPPSQYEVAGNSTDHFHAADRARANHTGTQVLVTITDVTITGADLNTLDDGANTTLHFHDADRARASHTGTQVMATISDLPVLASGVYTATFTGVTNIDSVTSFEAQYIRVGSIVTVSGKGTIDPTATGASEVGIALPVASNIGAVEDCCGVAAWTGIAQESAGITGDIANNRAAIRWVATDTTSQEVTFTFTYEII